MVYKIVMIRHGESLWNKENRFCGWFDSDLSEKGTYWHKILKYLRLICYIITITS